MSCVFPGPARYEVEGAANEVKSELVTLASLDLVFGSGRTLGGPRTRIIFHHHIITM